MRRLIYILTLFLAAGCTQEASATVTSAKFEAHLQSTDCAKVSREHAFSIRVSGWRFPVSNGYDFFGDELGAVVFRFVPGLTSQVSSTQPNDVGVSSADMALLQRAQSASISYGKRNAENDEQAQLGFERLTWRGLDFEFRSTTIGRSASVSSQQVRVILDGGINELIISAFDPQKIADILACAERGS